MGNEETVLCGVSQDTSISQVLFNIQTRNFFSIPLKSEIVCYVDDTVLICCGDNWDEVISNIKSDLILIEL